MARIVRAIERGKSYIFEVCPNDQCSHDGITALFHRTYTWGFGRVEGTTPEGDDLDESMSIEAMLEVIGQIEVPGPVDIVLDDVVGRQLAPGGRGGP